MLATLVIGLREGLEAALIVGIIAAFLRTNGKKLTPMWTGVALAVLLSIAVGVVLDIIEHALPQSKQEAMESVIGAIAIFFVTGMIIWMNTHARGMKRELETEAAEALSQGGAFALAVMAFLAVLKEGFETSVFLLATFSAAQSAALAATGAVIGVLIAVLVGWGIYIGGVRINLSRFFRFTGAFLILVAAGLVITTLRTAHEAGWINGGQQPTVSLRWLVAPGTVQSALITGVLGIPADPRRIEVIGWFAYAIPVSLFVYWPVRRRLNGRATIRLQSILAAGLTIAAVVLACVYPTAHADTPNHSSLVAADASGATRHVLGTAKLDRSAKALHTDIDGASTVVPLAAGQSKPDQHNGIDARVWTTTQSTTPTGKPSQISLETLLRLGNGRLPVGLNPQQHPGPFDARWAVHATTNVWVADGALLDASRQTNTVLTISGDGLHAPRAVTLPDTAASDNWQLAQQDLDATTAALNGAIAQRSERTLWAVQLPIVLLLVALLCAAAAARNVARLRRSPEHDSATEASDRRADRPTTDPEKRSSTYVSH